MASIATGGGDETLGAFLFECVYEGGHAAVFEGPAGLEGVELEVDGGGLFLCVCVCVCVCVDISHLCMHRTYIVG